jgi:hypothetical protein
MDVAFGDAVTPCQGESGGDRRQIVLQPTGEARQLCDPAGDRCRHPCRQVNPPTLPDQAQKGFAQGMCPRDVSIQLAELRHIRLGLKRLPGGRADHGKGHGPGGRPLATGIG